VLPLQLHVFACPASSIRTVILQMLRNRCLTVTSFARVELQDRKGLSNGLTSVQVKGPINHKLDIARCTQMEPTVQVGNQEPASVLMATADWEPLDRQRGAVQQMDTVQQIDTVQAMDIVRQQDTVQQHSEINHPQRETRTPLMSSNQEARPVPDGT